MKLYAVVAFMCLTVSASAGKFENWYFQFLLSPCNIAGTILTPDFKATGTVTGTSTGAISAGGDEIH